MMIAVDVVAIRTHTQMLLAMDMWSSGSVCFNQRVVTCVTARWHYYLYLKTLNLCDICVCVARSAPFNHIILTVYCVYVLIIARARHSPLDSAFLFNHSNQECCLKMRVRRDRVNVRYSLFCDSFT